MRQRIAADGDGAVTFFRGAECQCAAETRCAGRQRITAFSLRCGNRDGEIRRSGNQGKVVDEAIARWSHSGDREVDDGPGIRRNNGSGSDLQASPVDAAAGNVHGAPAVDGGGVGRAAAGNVH